MSFNKSISILLGLIPLSLIIGTAISNTVLLVFYFFLLTRIYSFNKKNLSFLLERENKVDILVIFFFLYLFLNLIINNNWTNIGRYISVIIFLSLIIFLRGLAINKFLNLKVYFIVNSGLFLFLIIDIYFQYFMGYDLLGNHIYFEKRLTGPWSEELVVGSFLIKFIIPIYFYWYYFINLKNKNYYQYLYYLFFYFIFLTVLITGERSATLIAGLALLLITFFYKKKIFYATFLILVVLNTLIIFSSNNYFAKRIQSVFIENISTFRNPSNESNIFSKENIYFKHYRASIEVFRHNPFFGVGLKKFRTDCKKYNSEEIKKSCTLHPHNYILEILSELGIFGFGILFILIYSIFKEAFLNLKKIKNKNLNYYLCIGFFISSVAIFFPLRPSGSFFSSWNGLMVWFNIFMLVYLTKRIDTK